MPRLDQRVRAPVDPDEDRFVLSDVGPQRVEVLLVVIAPHHDQRVTPLEVGGDVRHADAVEEQVTLLAEVVHGVLGEGLELVGHPLSSRRHGLLHRRCIEQGPVRERAVVADQLGTLQPHHRAVLERHHLVAHPVQQGDAGGHQDLRTQVGVATRDRCRGVDDGRGPTGHEGLGAHLVDVLVVDHGDVALLEAFGEVLGAWVDANRPAGPVVGAAVSASRETDGHHAHRAMSGPIPVRATGGLGHAPERPRCPNHPASWPARPPAPPRRPRAPRCGSRGRRRSARRPGAGRRGQPPGRDG